MGSILKGNKGAPPDDKGTTATKQAQPGQPGADLLGQEVEVESRKGTLRHLMTGVLIQEGQKIKHVFDGFLHGQWLSGRIVVTKDGERVDSAATAVPLPGAVITPEAKAAAQAPAPVTVTPVVPAAPAQVEPLVPPTQAAPETAPEADPADSTKKD